MNKLNRTLILDILLILCLLNANLFAYSNGTYYPDLTDPDHLYVVSIYKAGQMVKMPSNYDKYQRELAMIQSLSGILLKNGSSDGVFLDINDDTNLILGEIDSRRNITYEYVVNPKTTWWVVDQVKSVFNSNYVLYDIDSEPDSINVALMAAYKYNAIIVDVDLEADAISHGLTKVFDCTNKDDAWIWNNWRNDTTFRRDIGCEKSNDPTEPWAYAYTNDIIPAWGGYAYYEGANTTMRNNFLNHLDNDSPIFGWPNFDELEFTSRQSEFDIHLTTANNASCFAVLSAFRDSSTLDQPSSSNITVTPNRHYVTFVTSDGDNNQWFINSFLTHSSYWENQYAGTFNLGWGMSPVMCDLAQPVVEYLYDTATTKDNFVAMSPNGYAYPSLMSSAGRQTNATRLNDYMGKMDMSILTLLDYDGWTDPDIVDIYDDYLSKSNIDAIFYWEVRGDYSKHNGAIKWIYNKPMISGYESLWDGFNTPSGLATKLNARPIDPYTASGYSMIPVHVWSNDLSDIKTCIDNLDGDVEVVTPEQFVNLIETNVTPGADLYSWEWGDGRAAVYNYWNNISLQGNSTAQKCNGTPSLKVTCNNSYGFANMTTSAIDFSGTTPGSEFNFQLYGDGSGARVRLELYSSLYSSFLYKDITLDFTGWKNFRYYIHQASGGMDHYGSATRAQTLSSINIFQISGPWNSTACTFYLDNVRVKGYGSL